MIRNHILICGGTGCTSSGSHSVMEVLNAELEKNNLQDEVKVVMTDCTFNDNGNYSSKNKAVVETGDGQYKTSKFDITLTNCTATGFEANNSTSNLWGNKDSIPTDRLNVVIDGVDVY